MKFTQTLYMTDMTVENCHINKKLLPNLMYLENLTTVTISSESTQWEIIAGPQRSHGHDI